MEEKEYQKLIADSIHDPGETLKEIIRDRLLRMGLIGKEGHNHALDLLVEDLEKYISHMTREARWEGIAEEAEYHRKRKV